jgi:UDP-N-acetylmuramoyl-tripeptide--D-alanyl-D-alanine ligase
MKTIAQKILSLMTRLTLLKFKPVIVGITGSVGKTSTREAITAVLSKSFDVRQSQASYNNEFGLPFTVLGKKSPGTNPFGWLWLGISSLLTLLGGKYPHVLVLEMGADKPRDIPNLLKITGNIDYAVVTNVGISHLMNYSSPESLAKEKLSLIKGLKPGGLAVLNLDNDSIAKYVHAKGPERTTTFGFDQEANVAAVEINLINKPGAQGLNFKIRHQGTIVPVMLYDHLGKSSIYASLAAASVGLAMGMNLVEISEALAGFQAPPGRLRMLAGIKRTKIIDDTYNAAPTSTNLALEVLAQLAPGRKLAALGGMAELGAQNESGHREVAAKIQESGVSQLFLVGENAKIMQDELHKRHYTGTIQWFENSDACRMSVQNALQEGDTILIKGSQSSRMEKVVKEIMADPMSAEKLLVRQSAKWLNT